MKDTLKVLEDITEEEKNFFAEFMVEYNKRFGKKDHKHLGTVIIAFGSSLIALGAAISKNME